MKEKDPEQIGQSDQANPAKPRYLPARLIHYAATDAALVLGLLVAYVSQEKWLVVPKMRGSLVLTVRAFN